MSRTIGVFGYNLVKGGGSGLPIVPHVTIDLQRWGQHENVPTLSATLMTEREIDEEISRLKEDLDAVGRKAKVALRRARDGASP